MLDVEAFFAHTKIVVHERGGDGANGTDEALGEKLDDVGVDGDADGDGLFGDGGFDGEEENGEREENGDRVGDEKDKREEQEDVPEVVAGEFPTAFHGGGGGLLFDDVGGNGQSPTAGEKDAGSEEEEETDEAGGNAGERDHD